MSDKKFLYETHMHTFETSLCGIAKAADQVRIYKDRGYTGIIITDHLGTKNFKRSRFKHLKPLLTWGDKVDFLVSGYEKAKEEGDKIGLDVFFGWEFYADGSEFLTYGLDKDFLLKHKDLDKMPLKEYSKLVRENGGFLAHAHPYRAKRNVSVPVDLSLFDSVEIYNASSTHKGKQNAKAIVFAREHNLPVQAGTDAHFPNLKLYSGVALEKRAESIFDIINAIKGRTAEPILQPTEYFLLHGDLDDARNFAQAEEASDFLVKVFYDCHHAREVAEDLCEYIQEHTEFDTVCAHMDDMGHISKSGKRTKTIILGHHSKAKEMLNNMETLHYDHCGMRYGFNDGTSVLTASKSKIKKSKEIENKFVIDFCKRFDEHPDNMHTRAAQFKYVAMEFIQNGLQDFLKLDETAELI